MNGSIRKQGKGTWELTISLGRNSDGKPLRKYINVKGKRADADRKLRELLTSLDKGIPIDSKKVTLAEWMDKWMDEHVTAKRRQMTIERYERAIKRHILPDLGSVK